MMHDRLLFLPTLHKLRDFGLRYIDIFRLNGFQYVKGYKMAVSGCVNVCLMHDTVL